MKKKTISAILTAVNVVLVIAIILLIVKISMRQPLEQPVTEAGVSDSMMMDMQDSMENEVVEPEEVVSEKVIVAIPQTTSSVNVRTGPGVDFERIGSAYSDCEYVVLEVYDNGWTKLDYDGNEGYISSEYLSYRVKEFTKDGGEAYMDIDASELEVVPAPDIKAPLKETEESTEESAPVE